MDKIEPYKRAFRDIGPIIFRHVFILVNFVIFTVVTMLSIFGNTEAAVFLGVIITFNILLGIIQDTRARIALETLQLLTALRVMRVEKDGSDMSVLAEEVMKGDRIKLKLGDQIPCDGVMEVSKGLEVSEALITGESESFPKEEGASVSAGSIVTAGSGLFIAGSNFSDSKVAQMTKEAKRYSAKPSPIEMAIEKVIQYTGYVLLLIIAFVAVRGFLVGDTGVKMVLDIGALASAIVPQGLVVITTLLFAFGAASYSKKHVLFQEINSTEKLGRIKNLCLDKTGTLTDNLLVVEKMYAHEGISEEEAKVLALFYMHHSGDSSQTLNALAKYLGDTEESSAEIIGALPFSSWRQYGGVSYRSGRGEEAVFVGSSEAFLPHLSSEEEKKWLTNIIEKHAHEGKRLVCLARAKGAELSRELTGHNLSPVALFVLQDGLREGIRDAISFFQNRGIHIRIISGDSPDTVQSIARSAGVNGTETVVTGTEMDAWEEKDFDTLVEAHTIFARIRPEQKVKIIEAFKKTGFTAMVGDGANDALAIKKADLGIAMFDGVPATRRLAGVILMKNKFTDLPGGVELADNFIRNIEIFGGIFINQSFLTMFFFLIISIFGYAFSLTPLNITLINYFTVGIPGMLIGYWALVPSGKILPASSENFLRLVLPFVFWSAILEAVAVSAVFALSPAYLKAAGSNTLVGLAFIISGFIFFTFAPRVYRGVISKQEKTNLAWLAVFEIILLTIILKIPFLVHFFNITPEYPSFAETGKTLTVLLVYAIAQYFLTKRFFAISAKKW